MNQYKDKIGVDHTIEPCPSPAGVTYYEYTSQKISEETARIGFRPQQGLLIMNNS